MSNVANISKNLKFSLEYINFIIEYRMQKSRKDQIFILLESIFWIFDFLFFYHTSIRNNHNSSALQIYIYLSEKLI